MARLFGAMSLLGLWLMIVSVYPLNVDLLKSDMSDPTPECDVVGSSSPSTYQIDARTPPEWRFEDQFEFYDFWLKNEEDRVKAAILGVIDMLQTVLKVLGGTSGEGLAHGESDPSFQRYFRPDDLSIVGAILQRILAVTGAPNTSALRDCIQASKLLLIYGDRRGGDERDQRCAVETRGVYAYYNAFTDDHGNIRSHLSFCKRFFDDFKTHLWIDDKLRFVDATKLGNTIDIADPRRLPESESGATIVFHEMLHWSDVTMPVVPVQIEDLPLLRPDNSQRVTAYRSFYASKVKEPEWKSPQPPTENADNYVYMVMEIFYRCRYGLQPWVDSPDLHGGVNSPVVPPNYVASPPKE